LQQLHSENIKASPGRTSALTVITSEGPRIHDENNFLQSSFPYKPKRGNKNTLFEACNDTSISHDVENTETSKTPGIHSRSSKETCHQTNSMRILVERIQLTSVHNFDAM